MRSSTERMAGVSWGYWGRKVKAIALQEGRLHRTRQSRRRYREKPIALQSGFPLHAAVAMAFIYYVTQIQFDFGAVQLLKQECDRIGITRPLVVTDPGVKAAGVLQKALDALPGMPVAVFDQTPSNPTEAAVRAAVEVYRAGQCDGLIAVGGGSAIDCAKGVAIAATHEGPLTRYATIEG